MLDKPTVKLIDEKIFPFWSDNSTIILNNKILIDSLKCVQAHIQEVNNNYEIFEDKKIKPYIIDDNLIHFIEQLISDFNSDYLEDKCNSWKNNSKHYSSSIEMNEDLAEYFIDKKTLIAHDKKILA
ncbi:hypothetical protein PO181_00250 [Leuconostoc suionicum]|uniref:hypothetical protein n=1 Tax=Leuconostoc suionicum TaxID=1511761 RepID=UPI00233EE1A7|nr:hypothetical protein [Leuconostoc suionicum]MDC2815435.1 hypothetical protein [Leuconostoc suionicum]